MYKAVPVVGQLYEPRSQPGELLESRGLVATADALLHEFARLEHLQRNEAVQRRERGLADVGGDSVGLLHPGSPLMLDGRYQLRSKHALTSIKVLTRLRGDRPVEADVEDALELLSVLVLQQSPGGLGRALDAISGVLVHPCALLLNQDLLAGADEFQTLLLQARQGLVELLFGLDARR